MHCMFQRGTRKGLGFWGDLCGERRLECEAVGAIRRCGSCPARCRAGLVGGAIGGAWDCPAAEVVSRISGTSSQA